MAKVELRAVTSLIIEKHVPFCCLNSTLRARRIVYPEFSLAESFRC